MSGNSLYVSKEAAYYGVTKMTVVNVLLPGQLGRILDVGGSNGGTSRYLIDIGRAESALILDPYSSDESDGSVTFDRSDANDLSVFGKIADQGISFDTVMLLDVLEHLFDPWAVLQRINETVHTPGGRLIVCMPNARFVALLVPLIFKGRFDYKASGIMDKTHIRWFTRATTIELIEGAGYKVDRVDAYVERRVERINAATFGLFERFFEYQYIVQATKV